MANELDIAFALLRAAIAGAGENIPLTSHHLSFTSKDWWSLFRLMQQNHVAALVSEVVSTMDIPRDVKIPWLAECKRAEDWHRYQHEVQDDIVSIMRQHGIETLVLKGTHTARHYPKPELREFGDLDLYFYDKHDEADRVAGEVMKVAVSNDAHHHSKYNYRGVTVESHYDFVNRHYPPSNRRYEAMLKKLVSNSSPKLGEVADRRLDGGVCLNESLSTLNSQLSTFEVLFLLRHMAGHFASSRITLRDLTDWVLTCKALKDKADWAFVEKVIADYGMTDFVASINTIATQRLGTQPPSHPATQQPSHPVTQQPSNPVTQQPSNPATQSPSHSVTQSPSNSATQSPSNPATQAPSHSVTQSPSNSATQSPSNPVTQSLLEKDLVYGNIENYASDGFGRLLWKVRRWNALGWKRQMVYRDSKITLLLTGLLSHAEKPQSMLHKM